MKNNIRLLVIEDNEEIIDLIKLYKPRSMDIFDAKDGKEGLKLFYEEKFDLIILDLMLPILDGYQVLKKIRETSDIQIIILSSKNLDFEIILGLDKGADDYIVKPFNPMELFARVNALLRRVDSKNNNKIIKSGNLELNMETCEVFRSGKIIDLTGQEYKLLEFLMKNKNKVFTTDILLERIWNDNEYYDNNIVSVYISRLRDKIVDRDCEKKHIITIRGLGYKFND